MLAVLARRTLEERGVVIPEPTPEEQAQADAPLTLEQFVHAYWHVLEPGTPLAWGWALQAVCLHLEAAARREIMKLIINVPPGTMKSMLCNVFFPAWNWGENNPGERYLCTSFTESLSVRDSLAMRRLVESPEYQARYGLRVQLEHDQNSKLQYDTTARGRRLVKPITAATGARASVLIVDDPNNATEIHSPTHRRTINNAYDQSLRMRGADQSTFVQIVIMQRLHELDLTGHLLAKNSGWVHLRLPEEYEPEHPTITPIWKDPRTEAGELLFPEFRKRADVQAIKLDLGSAGTAGQLQQRPTPVGGGIVQEHWWRYHAPAHLLDRLQPFTVRVVMPDGTVDHRPAIVVPTPEDWDMELSSWDMTFDGKDDADFVVGQAWGSVGVDYYLRGQMRGRWAFGEAKRAMVTMAQEHPTMARHYVEASANGPAIMSETRTVLPGLIPVRAKGTKESRVIAEAATVESGHVYLPHPALNPWVADTFLPEWALFPAGANDDQVDATTQALQAFRQLRTLAAAQARTRSAPVPRLNPTAGAKTPTFRR